MVRSSNNLDVPAEGGAPATSGGAPATSGGDWLINQSIFNSYGTAFADIPPHTTRIEIQMTGSGGSGGRGSAIYGGILKIGHGGGGGGGGYTEIHLDKGKFITGGRIIIVNDQDLGDVTAAFDTQRGWSLIGTAYSGKDGTDGTDYSGNNPSGNNPSGNNPGGKGGSGWVESDVTDFFIIDGGAGDAGHSIAPYSLTYLRTSKGGESFRGTGGKSTLKALWQAGDSITGNDGSRGGGGAGGAAGANVGVGVGGSGGRGFALIRFYGLNDDSAA